MNQHLQRHHQYHPRHDHFGEAYNGDGYERRDSTRRDGIAHIGCDMGRIIRMLNYFETVAVEQH